MKVTFDNLGQIGINKDVPDYELPYNAWSSGENVRFDDGKVVKFLGHDDVYGTPTIAPYHTQFVLTASSSWWVYPGLTKVYTTDGTTEYNITRAAGGDYSADADEGWSSGVLNGIPFFNNSVDDPQVWATVAGGTPLTSMDWDASNTWSAQGYTCGTMRAYKNFLIALDFNNGSTRYPRQVRWSDAAVAGSLPSSWDDTDATKLAGFTTDLEETPGFVYDCLPQRDVNVIYKEDSTWGMQLTGGNDVFRFYKIFTNTGIMARNCVQEFEGNHVLLTPGPDLIVHDGQNIKSVLDKRWQKWLSNNIDSSNYKRSFVTLNYAKNEAWACFPSDASTFCDTALVWNYRTNTVGVRDLPQVSHISPGLVDPSEPLTWATYSGTWDTATGVWNARRYNPTSQDLLMAGPSDTLLYLADYTNQFNGSNITSYVERTGLAVAGQKRNGEPTIDINSIKSVTAIYPKIKAPNGTVVNVYVGAQMEIGDSVDWSTAQTFTVGTDYKVDIRKTGRLIAVKFETTGNVEWELPSYDLDIEISGVR